METLLRIGIPTFNRSKSLIRQLDFFVNEVDNNILSKIDFVVYNNASLDDTKKILSEYAENYKWIKYVNNPVNIGLVGNVNKVFNQSESIYSWAVGDDDILVDGILKKVIKNLEDNEKLQWLFLNHDAFEGRTGKSLMDSAILFKGGYFTKGRDAICSVFRDSGTTPMFITACVFKTNTVKQIIKIKSDNSLVDPLDYSFYCASRGPVFIDENVLIHNNWGTTSWSKESKNVLFYGVFSVLENLKAYDYSNHQIRILMCKNLELNIGNHLKGVLKGEKYSYALFKYYNVKIFKVICRFIWDRLQQKANEEN
jgi:hypothetical protein